MSNSTVIPGNKAPAKLASAELALGEASLKAGPLAKPGPRLAELLKRCGLLTDEQINAVLARKSEGGVSVTQMVVEGAMPGRPTFLRRLQNYLMRLSSG